VCRFRSVDVDAHRVRSIVVLETARDWFGDPSPVRRRSASIVDVERKLRRRAVAGGEYLAGDAPVFWGAKAESARTSVARTKETVQLFDLLRRQQIEV